jgi:phosphotriesterase-related protein
MTQDPPPAVVRTVLGPVPAEDLGVVAVHEALLSVLPGAEHGYDVVMDRVEIFDALAALLVGFREAGGGTLVDSTGMFHGRDVRLLEALSRTTGVHVVASTGQGPEGLLGGYFLTPQTNPPTPWPAEKFADLFTREVTEGMVVPRVERRGSAGLVVTAATATGMTATDESLLRGAARAALRTGVPVSFGAGADAVVEVEVALSEGLPAERLLVSDAGDQAAKVADLGAYVVLTNPSEVVAVAAAGHVERVLLATGGAGLSFGHDAPSAEYASLLTALPDDLVHQVLVANPRDLLTVKER